MAAITSLTTPRTAPRKVRMAVIFCHQECGDEFHGSTGCLRGNRLRGNFKLATPYVVANQARVTFAGRSEPVPRRTTTSGIRDALQVACYRRFYTKAQKRDTSSQEQGDSLP